MSEPLPRPLPAKILSTDGAVAVFGRPRSGTLVFTNGCFDLLHRGHVEYLDAARRMGDTLVVGLNDDGSVRRLKGADRPINRQEDRALVLAALEAVDAVVLFGDDTPLRLILRLQPDVLVKGGDYSPDAIVGAREVVAAGGRVEVVPLVPERSTTRIVHRLTGEGS
jgi:D-beta-D-heptose 7-phosphate kinase/D-beta-D-heptose 1-phosphate adenosyltransferase